MKALPTIAAAILCCSSAIGAEPAIMTSSYAALDAPLTTDPQAAFWAGAPQVIAERDTKGAAVPDHRTEVRSRWTKDNLYLLYICPYVQLNLKDNPQTATETNQLWKWDVAEAFIGSDFQNIRRYKEFELSPQGEWVDLNIDLDHPLAEGGWHWDSGFQVAARMDRDKKIWYGAMRIPYASIDPSPAKAGNRLRMNLFRSQGPKHQTVTWQPPLNDSFHTPERFGLLELVN